MSDRTREDYAAMFSPELMEQMTLFRGLMLQRDELLSALRMAAAGFAVIGNRLPEGPVKTFARECFTEAKAGINRIDPPMHGGA